MSVRKPLRAAIKNCYQMTLSSFVYAHRETTGQLSVSCFPQYQVLRRLTGIMQVISTAKQSSKHCHPGYSSPTAVCSDLWD